MPGLGILNAQGDLRRFSSSSRSSCKNHESSFLSMEGAQKEGGCISLVYFFYGLRLQGNYTCITHTNILQELFSLRVIVLGNKAHETSALRNYALLGYTPEMFRGIKCGQNYTHKAENCTIFCLARGNHPNFEKTLREFGLKFWCPANSESRSESCSENRVFI